jgi:hypothetical protein
VTNHDNHALFCGNERSGANEMNSTKDVIETTSGVSEKETLTVFSMIFHRVRYSSRLRDD